MPVTTAMKQVNVDVEDESSSLATHTHTLTHIDTQTDAPKMSIVSEEGRCEIGSLVKVSSV